MSNNEILELVEILAWPLTVVLILLVLRPHLTTLLSGTKLKLTLGGQAIETTLPEVKEILEEDHTAIDLSEVEITYLEDLRKNPKFYRSGVSDVKEREFLRPLRNAGLVSSVPQNARLKEIQVLNVSALGRLYLRSRRSNST